MSRSPNSGRSHIFGICLLLLGAGACAEGEAGAVASVLRDSAGITITESSAPVWRGVEAVILTAEPDVVIGSEDDPVYQFGRIDAATRLSDGRIAVFDGMANELRFFDAQGRFLSRAGGSGGGPGEYQRVSWMRRLAGDSLMLYDVSDRRITVLAPDGRFARSVSLTTSAPTPEQPDAAEGGPRVSGIYHVVAPFADGTMLARANLGGALSIGGPATRDSMVYLRLAPDGTPRDVIGNFVGDERQIQQSGSGGNMIIVVNPPPFGRNSQLAVDEDGFWFGSADRHELARYTADGHLVRIVRRLIEPMAVTSGDAEAQKEKELARLAAGARREVAAELRQLAETRWANATLPPTFPTHGDLRVDPDGQLWVQEITRPADLNPRWSAFDEHGQWLCTVSMPEDFRVLEFGRDYVLGVQRDENDVDQIRLYSLQAGGAGT